MPTYPISNVTRRVVYTGSAGVGPYAFTFEIIANTDVSVYKNDTLLTLTTDYSVTINANGTGSVTLVSAATGADRITIVGNRAVQRTTDFVTGGDLFANTLNDELDSQTIFVQQVAETTDRSIRAPVTDPTSINMVLPKNTDRANKALVFDANGDPAAGMAIFPGTLTATNYPRVNAGGTAYELRTPATVRADIGADNASNLASGTVADARLPSTMDSKTLTNVSISSGSIAGITDLAIADGGTGASTAANARTNLGLGTIATQNAASVAITGGSIAGITDLAIADGGTGASTASDARANLGLGSIATQSSTSVSITGGSVTGITDLAVADGGTGASTAADARTNLGLGTIATQSAASVSITGGSIAGITDLAVADGGTGASTATGARVNLLPSYTSNGGKVLALNVGATDVEWITVSTGGAGSGDVVGPASATDNAVVRFDGTTGKAVQNSAVTIADDGTTIISVNSATDALRITQTGAGNALVVEDSTNPDSTPFVVDASGNVGIGTTVPTLSVDVASNGFGFRANRFTTSTGTGSGLEMRKSASATVGTNAILANGETIGRLVFSGADGSSYPVAAEITGLVDGTPGTNDMPGRLVFSTTADGAASPTERMRITSAGRVGIGTSSPTNTLSVVGTANITGNTTLGTASGDTLTIRGTAVSVPNNLNFEANTLVVDASTSRVGIGTATPTDALNVIGGIDVRGTIEAQVALTQDAIAIAGRAGGTSSYVATITPTTLTASRTITLPDATTTVVGTDATQTLTNKTIQGGCITRATTVAASTTSVDFTNIPSWVKRITIMFQGVSTTGTSVPLVQLGTSGGVTITGYLGTGCNEGGTAANSTAGFPLRGTNAAANAISGTVVLSTLGSNVWVESGLLRFASSSLGMSGGDVTLGAVLDRVRITTVNGTDTFDAGNLNIMYEG